MKPEWNKKYTTIAVYSFLVLIGVATFILAVTHLSDIKAIVTNIIDVVAPLVGGIIVAYLLNPLLNLFDKKLFKKIGLKKNKTKLKRGLSIVCTYLIVIIAVSAFAMLFIPELISSYHTLVDKYGSIEKINAVIDSVVSNNKFLSDNYDKIIKILNIEEGGIIDKVLHLFSSLVPSVITAISSIANGVYIAALSLIFSVYVLCYKETLIATIKKICIAIFNKKHFDSVVMVLKTTDDNIGKYVRGKLLGSMMVGIVSYIAYTVFGFNFAPVLAVIAGVTNMIPYFGPFLGAIPAGIIVLIAQPEKLILLIIIILVLQQIDGNILDPLIVGNHIGLAPVWTMMATIVFGGFFGIPGMFLGVPVFATIYTFVRIKINSMLEAKNLPVATSMYYPEAELSNIDNSNSDENLNEASPKKQKTSNNKKGNKK